MHPVYTSHREEILAVYRHVAGIYIDNAMKGKLNQEKTDFIGSLFARIARIYLLFEDATEEIIRVSTEDLEFIKKICRYSQEHPECLEALRKQEAPA